MKRNSKVLFWVIVILGLSIIAPLAYFKISNWLEMRKISRVGGNELINIIVVSIDGGRPDLFKKAKTRTIFELARRGAYTFEAQTVAPSWTVPAHISMGTGLIPEHHGITMNRFETVTERALVIRAIKRYKSGEIKTIADYAKVGNDMRTIFVISKTSDFQPELRFLVGLRNLDELHKVDGGAAAIAGDASLALNLPEPVLLLIHFKEVDEAGHKFGWASQEQLEAVRKVDYAIGMILKNLRQSRKARNTYLIITADHGGHTERRGDGTAHGTHGTNHPDDMTILWMISGPRIARGHKIESPVNVCDTAATMLHILGIQIPENMDGKPVVEAFR